MKNEKQYLVNLLKQLQQPMQEDLQRLQLQKQTLKAGLLGVFAVLYLIWSQQSSWIIAIISIIVGVVLMLSGSIKNTLNNIQILRQHIDIKTIEQRLSNIEKNKPKEDE